ncbi:MAG: ribosomal L7Ae/L30e/S12e/Gadd45 family protein [Candidatus Nanohaloarchaea archaeon]
MTIADDVQEAAEDGNVVIGTEETVKAIDSLERVVLAHNVPDECAEAVAVAADGTDTVVEHVDVDNAELGSLCMKPFTASVVGLKG